MSIIDYFLIFVIVGVCGIIAQAVFNFRKSGFALSVLLGTIGAFLGVIIARMLEIPELLTIQIGYEAIPVFWSVMGSGIFAILLNIVIKRA